MTEKVRLIVWDLDETFWYGTLTEGGIRIRPETCALVKDLAARGIMSSICSKNNLADVQAVLEREGVWDYFIFPSVNWEPKGPRVAALVEAVQLRAPTVMFIDDNPMNLAEVADAVPGIQVQSHEYIPSIAAGEGLFAGKDDAALSRLAQYKLLETRKRDEQATPGDNTDFLRKSDIRVFIEYDVTSHLDRAVELINRTNQLNYLKKRLPEDLEKAKAALSQEITRYGVQAGLVRVVDNYGDYGFVGFFLMENGRRVVSSDRARQTLRQYCFSCRTLGMFVELWLYRYLGKPEITVVGDVLTDLASDVEVDWIRVVTIADQETRSQDRLVSEFRVHGGCDANAIGHYLTPYADRVIITGNFGAGGLFVRMNSLALLRSSCTYADADLKDEAAALELPYDMLTNKYFDSAREGIVFVFNGGLDAAVGDYRYRHKSKGWELRLEANGNPQFDFTRCSDEELIEQLGKLTYNSEETKAHVLKTIKHVRRYYDSVRRPIEPNVLEEMKWLFDSVPVKCRLIIILEADFRLAGDGSRIDIARITKYNKMVKDAIADYPYVSCVCYLDYLERPEENLGDSHYERMVYYRLAKGILSTLEHLPVKDA